MKLASSILMVTSLFTSAFVAETAIAAEAARPIILTGNFQMQVPLDPTAPTSDVIGALSQANTALGELMSKQCALLSDAFKRDCHVVQLNVGSNYSDNSSQGRFIRPGAVEALPSGNANMNVTFQLTPRVESAKPASDAK